MVDGSTPGGVVALFEAEKERDALATKSPLMTRAGAPVSSTLSDRITQWSPQWPVKLK